MPERASPVLRHAAKRESRSSFSGERTAKSLDLLWYEGGGGDVSVPEVTDLLQRLARGQRINVQGGQVNGGGGKLFMGALVVCAEAVHTSVEVLQINFFVILGEEKGRKKEKRESSFIDASFQQIK